MARAGAVIVLMAVLAALVGPLLVPYDPAAQELALRLAGPTGFHWFGLDELGRDILARVLAGGRVSLLVGLVVVSVSATVGVCLGAVTVVDEDRDAARALARREVALYLPVVAPLDPTVTDREWLDRITSAANRGDYEAVARDISDEMLDRFAYAGSPADLVGQVERLIAGGATRVEFGTPHGVDLMRGIRLLGERVLPALRAAS